MKKDTLIKIAISNEFVSKAIKNRMGKIKSLGSKFRNDPLTLKTRQQLHNINAMSQTASKKIPGNSFWNDLHERSSMAHIANFRLAQMRLRPRDYKKNKSLK